MNVEIGALILSLFMLVSIAWYLRIIGFGVK
jgi:hypothetical protein